MRTLVRLRGRVLAAETTRTAATGRRDFDAQETVVVVRATTSTAVVRVHGEDGRQVTHCAHQTALAWEQSRTDRSSARTRTVIIGRGRQMRDCSMTGQGRVLVVAVTAAG